MCGIAGVTSSGNEVSSEAVLGSLSHRGPDGAGVFDQSRFWRLFHTRLAIVDLTPAGDQPMINESGDLVMIFNGEIYNHQELRSLCTSRGHRLSSQMDGEVILHLWEDEGPSALRRLNGIFALAIGRPETGEIWLARDPLGVKPLFYSTDRGGLAFASEPAAMDALGAPDGGLDGTALAQFLTFLWVPDPRTPRRAVKSLLPGHVLAWTPSEGSSVTPYGEPFAPGSQPGAMDAGTALGQLSDLVDAAVKRQMMADVPVGLMASGGIDSTLVWRSCAGMLGAAYSIEWPDRASDEKLHEDAQTVRELEKTFGDPVTYLPGEQRPMGFLDTGDLFADPAVALAQQIAERSRADGIKVLLSGHGGDEVMGGYRRHAVAHAFLEPRRKAVLSKFSRIPLPLRKGLRAEYLHRIRRAVMQPDPFAAYMELCSYSTAAQRARALDANERDVSDEVVWSRHREVWDSLPAGLSMLRKAMALDTAVYLPGLGLAYMDRAGMQHGVEIRVPWLDLELVRFSLTLPDDLLVKGLDTKVLSKRAVESSVGAEVADRPKRGFAAPSAPSLGAAGDGRGFRQDQKFEEALRLLEASRLSTPGRAANT